VYTLMPTAGTDASPRARERDVLAPGTRAGPWIVEVELGSGGMGTVYAVVHETIGKRAALKLMHNRIAGEANAERILLEARVVNQVGHPNIIDIFESGRLDDGRPYLVMERLGGVSLAQRADEGKILPDACVAILLQICDALIAAHAAGVVHRDLKLDNVFLVDNPDEPSRPRVKLLDWGIAKLLGTREPHARGASGGAHTELTIDGQMVGTPQYLAPEQARGGVVTEKTDVYSLGVMAYELFVEQLPFEAETSAEIVAMHLRAQAPPPSELWPDVPIELEHLLMAMLAKPPDDRPTMLEVARALESVQVELVRRRSEPAVVVATAPCEVWQSAPGLAQTEMAKRPRARRLQYVLGAVALVAAAALFELARDGETDRAPAPAARVAPVAATPPQTRPAAPAPETSKRPALVAAPIHRGAPIAHAIKRDLPAVPRRAPRLDPDGTVDPYR
jgi:serine/threonine-protein kinase